MSEAIGRLYDRGPYRAWKVHPTREVWAICGSGGWNCWGDDGRVLFGSRDQAERVLRSHGFEPQEPRHA